MAEKLAFDVDTIQENLSYLIDAKNCFCAMRRSSFELQRLSRPVSSTDGEKVRLNV